MSKIIFTYITCKNKAEAKKIGKALLLTRLVACVNIFDSMESMYWWNGKLQTDKEVALVAKTKATLFPRLCNVVEKIHSYDTPCILAIEIKKGNRKYLNWLNANMVK